MPDVMDEFPHLKDMGTSDLHLRYAQLNVKPGGELDDQTLKELVCISRILRTRASVGKAARPPAEKRAPPTLDML